MPVAWMGRLSSSGFEAKKPVPSTWNRPQMMLSLA
jgi:hypothetical protein